MYNEDYIEYINSLHNYNAQNPNSYGEKNVNNSFFKDVMVEVGLSKFILNGLQNGVPHVLVLTGHAGDGKTSIMYQVLAEMGIEFDPDTKICDYKLLSGKTCRCIKDFSEIADEETPNVLVDELSGNYYAVFAESVDFGKDEIDAVNKLYKDLFDFVAVDICKLSNLFDMWGNQITTIDDFVELFYASLPTWGLPFKKMDLPVMKDLKGKRNILRIEQNFISRQMFKKLSKTQYNKYKSQIETYEKEQYEYSSSWSGWAKQLNYV